MTFFLLSHNYFARSSITKARPVFIKASKSTGPLRSNLKKAEVRVIPVDKYHKML